MILAEIDAQQLALQQLPTLGVLLIASVFWFGLFAKARKQLAAEAGQSTPGASGCPIGSCRRARRHG